MCSSLFPLNGRNRIPLWDVPFIWVLILAALGMNSRAQADEPDLRKFLQAHQFWDNRDWEWYEREIPFFDSPDEELNKTYYYRWEVVTKHLTYGSPTGGYSFTEFIDRPFWSGTYGAISCPAGHQIYEVRWLRDPRYARDYTKYWLRTPGAQPRRYSNWLADAAWGSHLVHPDRDYLINLLPDLIKNYEGWEESNFVPETGLFWQTGHDDGMEININSRQTKDTVRGAPAFRPTLNAYLYADALAIASIAELAGDQATAIKFRMKADSLKKLLQKNLWDPKRNFFFPMALQDEESEGFTVKAGSLTYQTGKYAGYPHGRELIGYVPWQFNMPDPGYEAAWKYLGDRDYFAADFGPTVTERNDPMFLIASYCCVWSGHSWPYATSQTLTAMANLLNNYQQKVVTKKDYFQLLRTYALSHRKVLDPNTGKSIPYIAEGIHPDTGSWEGYDSMNHSEHYFHSSFCDLIITGLVGLRPRSDDLLVLNPLVPEDWDYFLLTKVPYRGHLLTIVWDRTGKKYSQGKGLSVWSEGKLLGGMKTLGKLELALPPAQAPQRKLRHNYAVNNDGNHYPKLTASFTAQGTSLGSAQDGNFYYHRVRPTNRWTCEESPNESDTILLDLGTTRRVDQLKLYWLDDQEEGGMIAPPSDILVEHAVGDGWHVVETGPQEGRRANVIEFASAELRKLRITMDHRPGYKSGLTELELWGDGDSNYQPPPDPPAGPATNRSGKGFPKASASFTSRFDQVEFVNDGKVNFLPNPHNRWTSYESKNEEDWLEIDFGKKMELGRIELSIYDDRGGVQAPESYRVEYWDGSDWIEIKELEMTPEKPAGGIVNTVRFSPVSTEKFRVVFRHAGTARTGLTEIEAWSK